MIVTRTTCRICGSDKLSSVLNLGRQALASNFNMDEKFPPTERKIPLELVRCDPERDERACGLVQLKHTVPPNLMYSSYGYRSGINMTMREHLRGIAKYATEISDHLARGFIVDIGANDGTLLSYYERNAQKGAEWTSFGPSFVAFEPSNVAPLDKLNNVTWIRDFFPQGYPELLTHYSTRHMWFPPKAGIITSIAMFYDLEDPNAFVHAISNFLAPRGVWIFEMSYLPSMLANASFDTVCHEHLEYYSLAVIRRLLQKHGLDILDASLNNANGGSLRVTAAHRVHVSERITDDAKARIYDLERKEFDLALDTAHPYNAFAEKVRDVGQELGTLLLKLRAEGKRIYGYGASTKGNVILQYCGITPEHITAIADRNPQKHGGLTVGTKIPIVSEEFMRDCKPDYLLVLPWHFMREFREREAEFVARGGKFIVPVPKVEVL